MSVQKFRKKPVVVEAMPTSTVLESDSDTLMRAYWWIEENTLGSFDCNPIIDGEEGAVWPASGVSIDARDGRMVIATLEGGHWVDLGDWIIRGVEGEFYPCKPQIFDKSYELA